VPPPRPASPRFLVLPRNPATPESAVEYGRTRARGAGGRRPRRPRGGPSPLVRTGSGCRRESAESYFNSSRFSESPPPLPPPGSPPSLPPSPPPAGSAASLPPPPSLPAPPESPLKRSPPPLPPSKTKQTSSQRGHVPAKRPAPEHHSGARRML